MKDGRLLFLLRVKSFVGRNLAPVLTTNADRRRAGESVHDTVMKAIALMTV